MQRSQVRKYGYVHIISLWLSCVLWGMILFYCFRHDFVPMISQKQLAPHLLFSLLISSFIPVLLAVFFLLFSRFILCCFVIGISAFFYGFSLLAYISAGFLWLPFSKTCGAVLLLLLVFIWLYKPYHLVKKSFFVFLVSDLFFVLLDYFVCYRMYF